MRNKLATLSYTAGIIDGEGSIMLVKAHRQKPYPSSAITLIVTVSNTNEWLIHWLQFNYGGKVRERISRKKNGKDAWEWTLHSKGAADFLKMILPYLQMKRPQAEIGICFQENKRLTSHKSDAEKAVQEADRILMRQFNKRGKTNVTEV